MIITAFAQDSNGVFCVVEAIEVSGMYHWRRIRSMYSSPAKPGDLPLNGDLPLPLRVDSGERVRVEHLKQLPQTDEVKVLGMKIALRGSQ